MSCLPESGGCERPFTDAFVDFLNRSKGAHYMHRACLDRDSSAPEPEALYVDAQTNRELVIERKSISWPTDYPYRHSNDHFVSQVFSQALRDLKFNDLYEVRFPMLIRGKREELRPFVLAAADAIRADWAKIASGVALKQRVGADWWWAFRRLPEVEREDNSPSMGLLVTWVGRSMRLNDYLDPTRLPEDLARALRKIYSACTAKFAGYADPQRVLILDPHGDLRHQPTAWWTELWSALPPAVEIQEIWSGTFDYIDDESQDRQFERLL
jgi:hypothetical protein